MARISSRLFICHINTFTVFLKEFNKLNVVHFLLALFLLPQIILVKGGLAALNVLDIVGVALFRYLEDRYFGELFKEMPMFFRGNEIFLVDKLQF